MNASRKAATGGIIAALYVILTYIADSLGLASGAVQVRFSEALALLPCLTSAAIPGLALGCLTANLLTGCAVWDVIFGSAATLLGAAGTFALRKSPRLSWIPPVVSNTLIIPPILIYVYGAKEFWPLIALQIFIGEMISCGVLGSAVLHIAQKYKVISDGSR